MGIQMQTKHNAHDAQYSYEVKNMGSMHVNMNSTATSNLKTGRVSGDDPRAMNTKRTERRDNVEPSQNTSNALSSSQAGKRF